MTTYLGKSCSFCLPPVPFVNCCQFMYLVISLLVLRAGYGIWLYQFLIIAYLFTFMWCGSITYDHCFYWCSLAISRNLTPCHSPFRGITSNFSCVHIFQIFLYVSFASPSWNLSLVINITIGSLAEVVSSVDLKTRKKNIKTLKA